MTTSAVAAILLGIAALGGVTLFALRARGSNPPLAFAMIHGLAAAAGVFTLAVAVLGQGEGGAAVIALTLFVVAALGGAYLLLTHLRGTLLPVGVIVGHGAAAAAGFVTLLVHVVR